MRRSLARVAEDMGLQVEDLGPSPEDGSVDYPIYARKVGEAVVSTPDSFGILICGTGIGMSIAANKVRGVRAALVSEPHGAALARRHNDANVICFGAGSVGSDLAASCLAAYLEARFEGGRHQRRVDQIHSIEAQGGQG